MSKRHGLMVQSVGNIRSYTTKMENLMSLIVEIIKIADTGYTRIHVI